MELFTHEKISDNVILIKDAFGVGMYLVTGKDKACLLDTGYGVTGLKEYVETITSLPVIVLLSHGHVDHAMGCVEFDEVYMNYADLDLYKVHSNQEFRELFIQVGFEKLKDIELQEVRVDFLDLVDEASFDLGEVHIKAIHTPGHTPGMMMFLIQEERMIVFGDQCGPGTILIEDFSTDVKTYYQSLLKVKKIELKYDVVLRNHGTCRSSKEILDNVIELCVNILEGKDAHLEVPSEMIQGLPIGDLKIYSAKNPLDIQKEGNLMYREDKI